MSRRACERGRYACRVRGARTRADVFGILLIALLAAGCGGSSYTKSDFVARANAICSGALRQTRSIAPPSATQASGGQDGALAAYLSSVVPVLEREASQLKELRRPPGSEREKTTLGLYLAALTRTVAEYKSLAAAAKRGDDQAVADAEAALSSSPVYSLAASYGLRSCGTPGATTA